jgi:hypothetical protein
MTKSADSYKQANSEGGRGRREKEKRRGGY